MTVREENSEALDRFRRAWRDRVGDAPFEGADSGSRGELVQRVALLDRGRRRREGREVVIAAGASGIGVAALWATEPWLRAWTLILCATGVLIAVWRYKAMVGRRSRVHTDSVAAFCRAELSRIDTEIRLQRSLFWWYLAPLLIGTNLFVALVSRAAAAEMAVFVPISLIAAVVIALATRRSLRRALLPRRAELLRCLAELETDGDARVTSPQRAPAEGTGE